MALEENERLIADITNEIEELKSRGDMDALAASSLEKFLKMHRGDLESRKGFLKVQQELSTRFTGRLKNDYPRLTESQLRLASLIASGLDTPRICRILNIEASSLHKSRYRLRSRMNLASEISLEDFLRRYQQEDAD